MNRRQALAACAVLWPFAQEANAQGKDTKLWTSDKSLFAVIEQRNMLSFNMTSGTITISNKNRSVTVSLDEIMDALDPPKEKP